MSGARAARSVVAAGSLLAIAGTVHCALNARLLRVPPPDPPLVSERVSLLMPARNEAERVGPALEALLTQQHLAQAEVIVLDDQSNDATGDVLRRLCEPFAHAQVVSGTAPEPGAPGKAHACQQLAALAQGRVLVFVDADVVLSPYAVASCVAVLRGAGLDLVSPFPCQAAAGLANRLFQPLLQWSWLTALPLRRAETSARPGLSAANGQFLIADAAALARCGGFAAVADEVLEDMALVRAFKRAGKRGGIVDGSRIAVCRMYDGWPQLREGYSKSLWAAFGSGGGAAAVCALLVWAYVIPPLAALRGSAWGAAGYGAAVLGRVLAARRTGGRCWPDALAHPVSIALLTALTARSWLGHRRSTLTWKGRRLRGVR
ncbi:glycosyltransferase [Streptomyces sp. NPDC056296]|uniref:glycosyltransferase n=1 Tax=Streptomyces sp. NPDC056296 TaxID=3345775 RepID=UPI0035DD595A